MDPKSVNCVIYHGNCSDGFGAAWAAWKVLGNKAEYHAAFHGKAPPDVTGKRVVVLDFAYDKKITKHLIATAEDFEMRDHHKSAMMMLDGIAKPDWFQLGNSGAILAWEYFHRGIPAPRFLQFIENRDMGWKPYMEYSKEFSTAFDMIPLEFPAYDRMMNASVVDDCIRKGSHILPYADAAIDKVCSKAVKRKLQEHCVLVVNSTQWISEVGMRLAPDCDYAIVWYWDHNEKYAKVSLRSFHDHIDCGSIAKRFGGGGHAEIAGFEYSGNIEDLFKKQIKTLRIETKDSGAQQLTGSSELGYDLDVDSSSFGK